MNLPMYESEIFTHKIDICFYDSLLSIQSNNKYLRIFYFIRIVFTIWHISVHLKSDVQLIDQAKIKIYAWITVAYQLFIAFNLATFAYETWIYHRILKNKQVINYIAVKMQNCQLMSQEHIQDMNLSEHPRQNNFLVVSKQIYQFSSNLSVVDIDQQYRRRALRSCQSLLSQQISLFSACYRLLSQLFNLISIGITIFTILIISNGSQVCGGDFQFDFLIAYLGLEVLVRLVVYLILIVVALSPLCCLGLAVYACCFRKPQRQLRLPQVLNATMDHIRDCEGDCPICYQNILQNEKIIVLRCSPKHVFHQLCIKGWTKIGKTCPNCRVPI